MYEALGNIMVSNQALLGFWGAYASLRDLEEASLAQLSLLHKHLPIALDRLSVPSAVHELEGDCTKVLWLGREGREARIEPTHTYGVLAMLPWPVSTKKTGPGPYIIPTGYSVGVHNNVSHYWLPNAMMMSVLGRLAICAGNNFRV